MAVRAPALSNTQPAVAIKINSKPNQNAPHERPGRQVAAPCRWRQEAIPGTRMTSRKSAGLGARTRPSGDLVLSVVGHRGPPVATLDSPRARIALAAPDIATSWRRSGLVTSSAPRWSSPLAVGVNFACIVRSRCTSSLRPRCASPAAWRPASATVAGSASQRQAMRDRGHRFRFRHFCIPTERWERSPVRLSICWPRMGADRGSRP
jgi:hypothetical protein